MKGSRQADIFVSLSGLLPDFFSSGHLSFGVMGDEAGSRGRRKGRGRLERAAAFVAGLYLTGTGASHLVSGRALYSNYLGAPVFAPWTIVIGALLLGISLFAWHKIVKYL